MMTMTSGCIFYKQIYKRKKTGGIMKKKKQEERERAIESPDK
jgi:hypothetical protein